MDRSGSSIHDYNNDMMHILVTKDIQNLTEMGNNLRGEIGECKKMINDCASQVSTI